MPTIQELIDEVSRHYDAHNMAEARRVAEEILARDPQNVLALRVIGVTIRDENPAASLDYLRKAVDLAPTSGALRFEIGVTLMRLLRQEEAYEQFLKCIELKPKLDAAYVNLSAIAEQQERHDDALKWGRMALAVKPDCALAYYNISNALRERGQMDESTACLRKAIECDPSIVKAHWNLGMNLLLTGHFKEGWPLFEHRAEAEEVEFDKHAEPRWQGEPLDDKTILVHAEQGIGDEVLFSTCFHDLIARARKCIFLCDPRLARLFARSFPDAMVYGYQRRPDRTPAPVREHVDCQISAGSLPMHLRPDWDSFHKRRSFLVTNPQLDQLWRERLAALGPGLKVGISWRAGGKPVERRKRSVPLGEPWRGVLTMPGVHFVNLQYSDSLDDLAAARARFGVEVHDWEDGDPLVDMDAYASKIAALDLVISVGNATVHLAGAVGTPAWALLPMMPSWRWMVRGEETPWYTSVRLYRQPLPGEWAPVFDRVTKMLRELVAERMPELRDAVTHAPPAEPAAALPPPGDDSAADESAHWLEADEISAKVMIEQMGAKLEEASAAHQAGQWDRAEQLYRQLLRIAPRHAPALHGLGVLARQTGRLELAIRSLQRAVASLEFNAIYHFNLATALAEAKRVDEALAHFRRSLELDPACVPAHRELGLLLARHRGHELALDHFCQALKLDPDQPAVHVHQGRSLAALCRPEEAIASFQRALALRPDCMEAHLALGETYLDDQLHEQAESSFRKAIELEPDRALAHYHLGRCLYMRQRPNDAVACYEQALDLDPNCLPAMLCLATVRREQGDPQVAVVLLLRAIGQQPDRPDVLNTLGLALQDLGKWDESLQSFDNALRLNPELAAARANRALLLLQTGQLAAGWREYECRWQSTQGARPRTYFSQPTWDGGPLAGKTILVHAEQALGDEIMFATCYPDVIEQAKQCVLLCDPRLEKLMRRSFPAARVFGVTRGREHSWRAPAGLAIDVQIAAGSLPHRLRNDWHAFPRRERLLTADPELTAGWRNMLSSLGDGLKVGISWLAGEKAEDRRLRSSSLDLWRELLATKGVHWINVQHGDVGAELWQVMEQTGVTIHQWSQGETQRDVDSLAAQIAALDLVIAVGNTTVHLAGALGVPTLAVLPRWHGWRWFTDRQDCPWYPSVRLYRQAAPNDWNEPIGQARQELLNRLARKDDTNKMRSVPTPHWPLTLPIGGQPAAAHGA